MNATNHRTLTRGWLVGLTAVASCLFLSQLAGPTPSPQAPATDKNQQPGPTIKAESRLVLVDAIVTNKKGNYVHDLTRNDLALSPIRILRVPRHGSHLSAWPSDYSLLSASSTSFFILLFRRNELLHARCHVVHPGARPWRISTPLLPIIEFP